MSRPSRTGTASSPVTIRADSAERLLWRSAAQLTGRTVSDWARKALNRAATRVVERGAKR